jgi:hypothetical protein
MGSDQFVGHVQGLARIAELGQSFVKSCGECRGDGFVLVGKPREVTPEPDALDLLDLLMLAALEFGPELLGLLAEMAITAAILDELLGDGEL